MSTNFRYHVLKNVRPYKKFLPQLTKPVLRILIQVSVHYIESKKCSPECLDLALAKLTSNGHGIPENFCELFAAILQIMQIFLRTPKDHVKDYELRDCLKELRMSEECADDLSKVLYNHRVTLTKNLAEFKSPKTVAKTLQWRINISLCDSFNKEPTIILNFHLPNGKKRTLELPLSMFRRLRLNMALLLSEMQVLENRSVMKKF